MLGFGQDQAPFILVFPGMGVLTSVLSSRSWIQMHPSCLQLGEGSAPHDLSATGHLSCHGPRWPVDFSATRLGL